MDNIQKLILGVLAVSGMIAMLVPSGASVRPKAESVAVAVAVPVSEPVVMADDGSAEEEPTEESEFVDEDIFMTGEPAINGNPMQGQSNPNPDMPVQPVQQYIPPAIDYGQPVTAAAVTEYPQPMPTN